MRMATFNARSDTVASKPMFREAFKKRRCLIPASGYYEWQSIGKEKQPWYFTRNDGEPITIAGLHEAWNNPETGERTAAAPRASAPVFARAAGRPTQMDDVCWHFASFAARISLLRVSDAGRSRHSGAHRGRRPKAFNGRNRGKGYVELCGAHYGDLIAGADGFGRGGDEPAGCSRAMRSMGKQEVTSNDEVWCSV
jgi:putative SOS response-associated peptidase YedK